MPKLARMRICSPVVRHVGLAGERVAQLLRQRGGFAGPCLGQDEQELIAAVAADDVGGPRLLLEQPGHLAQDGSPVGWP